MTFRGKYSKDYDYSEYDDRDPWEANCDLIVSLEEHEWVRSVGYWKGHVYCSLNTGRYDWTAAETIIEEFREMIDDAVVIGANDTTDTGCARYYPVAHRGVNWTDEYEEVGQQDGHVVGAIAASVMTARHGIVAQERLCYRADSDAAWDSGVRDSQRETGRDMADVLGD